MFFILIVLAGFVDFNEAIVKPKDQTYVGIIIDENDDYRIRIKHNVGTPIEGFKEYYLVIA